MGTPTSTWGSQTIMKTYYVHGYGFAQIAKCTGGAFADKEQQGVTFIDVNAYGRCAKVQHPCHSGSGRVTIEWWNCYLDSFGLYHTFFIKEFLSNIKEGGTTMNGRCNASTTVTNTQGLYRAFNVWLNKYGIANLISILMLKPNGYLVSTHTHREWKVTTPKGDAIPFKHDTGLCIGILYIDLREQREGLVMIKTARKNFAGFTEKKISKARLSRLAQGKVGHPPDGRFKTFISEKVLKTFPVEVADVTNAHTIHGPNLNQLQWETTRQTPHGVREGRLEIPRDFYQLNKFLS